jgi:hypothetical protein
MNSPAVSLLRNGAVDREDSAEAAGIDLLPCVNESKKRRAGA